MLEGCGLSLHVAAIFTPCCKFLKAQQRMRSAEITTAGPNARKTCAPVCLSSMLMSCFAVNVVGYGQVFPSWGWRAGQGNGVGEDEGQKAELSAAGTHCLHSAGLAAGLSSAGTVSSMSGSQQEELLRGVCCALG